jgi:hypothetical protein
MNLMIGYNFLELWFLRGYGFYEGYGLFATRVMVFYEGIVFTRDGFYEGYFWEFAIRSVLLVVEIY